MSILARLGVVLGLNTTEFTAGLDKTDRELKRFEANARKSLKRAEQASAELSATMGKLAVGAGVAALGIGKILQKSDEIADMASAFDASIGGIIGMGKALDLAGGKAEVTSNLLSKLSQNAQAAKEGNDKLRISFKELGISAGEVQNLAPDELFNRVAQELAKVTDPVERNAKAFELLGKSAKGIDWNKYTQEYKQITDPDLVQAIQTSAEAWDNIQKSVGSMYYFIVKLIQPLSALVNDFLTLADRYKQFKEEGGTINFDPNNPMGEGIEFQGTGKPKTFPEKTVTGKKTDGGYKEESAEDKRIKAAREAIRLAVERNALEVKRIELEMRKDKLSEYEYKRQSESLDLEKTLLDLRTKINDLQKQQTKENAASTKIQIDGLNKQIEMEKEKSALRTESINKEEEKSQSWAYGWEQAFKKYGEDAKNAAKIGEESFKSAASNMEDAIVKFVTTGKFNFKSFAQSVIADLLAIQARALATQILSKAFGGLGSLFSSGSSSTGLASLGPYVKAGFANGGEPPMNVPSLVGERGPELFIPKTQGTIVPNNQLSSALGSTTNITNNYIDAIDTKSFEDRLYGSANAVWAANQYAGNKNLATSRSRA